MKHDLHLTRIAWLGIVGIVVSTLLLSQTTFAESYTTNANKATADLTNMQKQPVSPDTVKSKIQISSLKGHVSIINSRGPTILSITNTDSQDASTFLVAVKGGSISYAASDHGKIKKVNDNTLVLTTKSPIKKYQTVTIQVDWKAKPKISSGFYDISDLGAYPVFVSMAPSLNDVGQLPHYTNISVQTLPLPIPPIFVSPQSIPISGTTAGITPGSPVYLTLVANNNGNPFPTPPYLFFPAITGPDGKFGTSVDPRQSPFMYNDPTSDDSVAVYGLYFVYADDKIFNPSIEGSTWFVLLPPPPPTSVPRQNPDYVQGTCGTAQLHLRTNPLPYSDPNDGKYYMGVLPENIGLYDYATGQLDCISNPNSFSVPIVQNFDACADQSGQTVVTLPPGYKLTSDGMYKIFGPSATPTQQWNNVYTYYGLPIKTCIPLAFDSNHNLKPFKLNISDNISECTVETGTYGSSYPVCHKID